MEVNTVCRCCLIEGMHKLFDYNHICLGSKENYKEIVEDCFGVVLSSPGVMTPGICNQCIISLRNAWEFKLQVVKTDKKFHEKILSMERDQKPVIVKEEVNYESDYNDSDDYFLADTVIKSLSSPSIKSEAEEPMETKKQGKITQDSSKVIKTSIVKKESNPTKRKIADRKIVHTTLKLSSKSKTLLKEKHRENLQTILQYSNVMPFKNKTLLGYICGYCDVTIQDPKELRIHNEEKHATERVDYNTRFEMANYSIKLDITDLKCNICNTEMANLNIFKEHITKKHSKTIHFDIKDHLMQYKLRLGDVYDCALCSSTYETFKMLKQHMNKHYRNYDCNKCESSFATKRSLTAHKTTHIKGSYKCDHCEKIFDNRLKKHYHEKQSHAGIRNIGNCIHCNEPFRNYYQRNQHMIKVHNSQVQYRCNICDKGYILKSLLMSHIKKNHLLERDCQCTECGYRFFSKKALKAHMVKHTGERKYVCEVCSKSYARKYTLREHMRIHNNDRRFKCLVCELSFVQKCSLKSHLLSNHGISMQASDITSTQ